MNKEKTLDIIAGIVVFVGKFIITPLVVLIVITAMWCVGVDTYHRHIPMRDWLIAFGTVLPLFGGIWLLSWASVRRERKLWD